MKSLLNELRQFIAEWLLDRACRVAPANTEEGQIVRRHIVCCMMALCARSSIPEKLRDKTSR